jgi:Thioredoxin-like
VSSFNPNLASFWTVLRAPLPLFLLLLASGQLLAQPLLPSPPSLQSLKVTVTDAASGAPVPDAKVSVPQWASIIVEGRTNNPVARTDARGLAELWILPAPNNFSISVEHPSYASREARWYDNRGNALVAPQNYAFRLNPGIVVGGYVRNEKGAPVPGASVLVYGDGYEYASGPGTPNVHQEFSAVQRDESTASITDESGFWARSGFPPDLNRFRVEVLRPGGARTAFLSPAMKSLTSDPSPEVYLADLRATNVLLTIKEGVTVRGLVTDQADKPISGVVIKERVGRQYYGRNYQLTNESDGKFMLPHRGPAQLVLTALAPGFAARSVIVTPTQDLAEVKVVLSPAVPLRIRVLGETNEPIQGASFRIDEYRSGAQILDWTAVTDADGRATWTNAPNQPVTFYVSGPGYPPRSVTAQAAAAEKVVRMQKNLSSRVSVHMLVTDAQTGRPVEKFEVWRDMQWNRFQQPWITNAGKGELRAEISANDTQGRGTVSAYQLQVRAEGYSPWSSEYMNFVDGDQEFTVKLTNAPPPAGVVLQPDGTPAVGAKVYLSTRDQSLFMGRPGDLYAYQGLQTEITAADGSFRFGSVEDINPIVVQHPSGFGSLRVQNLRQAGKIQLQSWGKAQGTLRNAGGAVPNERVSIKSAAPWSSTEESYRLIYSATTGPDGAFTFTNLPPGEYVLYRQPFLIMGPTMESHRFPLQVAANETKKVDYTLGGRTVVGRVETTAEVNWQNDPHMLVLRQAEPPPEPFYNDFVDPKAYDKARAAYGASLPVREFERKRQQFQLVFDRDGNFRADDVPPGDYELRIRLTKPPDDPNRRFGGNQPEIGSLKKQVTVRSGPAGEEFDLGSFEMEVKGSTPAFTQIISFQTTTLDGKPVNLENLRGQLLLVVFWADWAPLSAATLADLRALRSESNPSSKIRILTINHHDDAKTAEQGIQGLKDALHVHLQGRERIDLTSQLGIDVLPTTLLLDAQGKVIARDVSGKRLRAAITRALSQIAKK